MITFKAFVKELKELKEETTSADIATVDTKLDTVKRPKPGSTPCTKHKIIDCKLCSK